MRTLSLFSLLLLFSLNSFAGNDYISYYRLCNKALTYKALKEPEKAIDLYEKAFIIAFPFPYDVNFLKECYFAVGEKEKAYACMKRMILCGFKEKEHVPFVTGNTGLTDFLNPLDCEDTLMKKQFAKEYPDLRKAFLKQVNWEKEQYLSIIKATEVFSNFMRHNAPNEKFFTIQGAGFSTQRILLTNLFKEKKDLKREETDSWSDSRFAIALIHSTLSLIDSAFTKEGEEEMFFSLLWEQVNLGNLHPLQYAVLVDEIYYHKHDTSFYGVKSNFLFDENKKWVLFSPIKDIQNLDKRRAEIHLPPLWVYCLEKGIDLPENYSY